MPCLDRLTRLVPAVSPMSGSPTLDTEKKKKKKKTEKLSEANLQLPHAYGRRSNNMQTLSDSHAFSELY